MRDANWWLESTRIGRMTVGRLTSSGVQTTIDLGGVGVVAGSAFSNIGGGLRYVELATSDLTAYTVSNLGDSAGDYQARKDGIKWTSPTVQGFIVSASIGETLRAAPLSEPSATVVMAVSSASICATLASSTA